jgi:isopenicillin N synthase-like dioxygenase
MSKNMKSLPIVNLSGLASSSLAERRAVATELGRACREIGFFYASDHGIPEAMCDAVFSAARDFFSMPLESKEQVSCKRSLYRDRGYFALEDERLNVDSSVPDYKEAFDVALDLRPDDPEVLAGKPYRGVNPWPAIPGWRETMLSYYDACWALGRRIHRGFALDLGAEENFFDDKLDAPMAVLRVLHYPPRPMTRDSAPDAGAGTHTDYGNLTILIDDGVAGLQVRARSGDWIDVPKIPGTFICNISDCLMRWTNDVYVSTPHRVGIPARDRFAVAFFLDPNPEARVEVLKSCVPSGSIAKYPPTTGLDYWRYRHDATFAHEKAGA